MPWQPRFDGPSLHDAGLWAHATVRAQPVEGVTNLATPRSQTISAGSVYHARLDKNSFIETRDSRYKAGERWT